MCPAVPGKQFPCSHTASALRVFPPPPQWSQRLGKKGMMKISLVLLYGVCSRGKIPSAIHTLIIEQYRPIESKC